MAPNTIVLTGYYADAVLKFTVQFPADYPSRPPVVHFLSDVFHPLIGPQDGVLNLKPRFRPWRCPQSHFSSGSMMLMCLSGQTSTAPLTCFTTSSPLSRSVFNRPFIADIDRPYRSTCWTRCHTLHVAYIGPSDMLYRSRKWTALIKRRSGRCFALLGYFILII
jgi:hypothetical protein